MLQSFARMLPELLRHSDRTDVFERMPQHLKEAHRPRAVERDDAPLVAVATTTPTRASKPKLSALWDDAPEDVGSGGSGGGGDAAEALAMFASAEGGGGSLEDDLALLEGAGF